MADDSVKIDIKLEDAKAKAEASKAGKDISKNLEKGLKGASTAAKNSESQIKSAMSGAAASSKSSFSDVGSSAKSNFSGVSDAAKTASSDSSSSFQNIASDSKGSFQGVGDAAKDGFEGVSDAADQVADDVDNTFSGVFPSATGIAIAAATALATAVAAIATQAVQVGMEFDKSMSQVAATMGVTTDQIGELRDFAQEMGATTAFSATQASEALNYMALAGYDAETSMRVLPTVLNLAAAGNMELAAASDMVTDAQSALGLSVSEAEVMVDQMAMTSSKTNTSVEQLGNAFLTVGGTAKNLKGGTAELAQMLGILADNGIKGSEGGTALRNVILSLSAPTDTAAKKIQELGLQVFDAEGNMRSMPDIVNDLNASLGSLTQQEKTEVLNTIFNKVDLKSVNALLGTSSERFNEVAASIDNAAGSAQKMADTQLDNLAGDVTLLQSAAEGLAIQVSDVMTPALRGATQFMTNALMPALSALVANFGHIAVAVVSFTATIAAMKLYNKVATAMKTHTVQMGGYFNVLGKQVKLTGTSFKVATVASRAFSTALNAIKAAAPMIVMTLVVEAAMALAGAFEEAQKDAANFEKATTGLVNALEPMAAEMENAVDAVNSMDTSSAIKSVNGLKDAIKENVEAQAELADKYSETWGGIKGSEVLVTSYMDTIEKLTNKTDENGNSVKLNTVEQAQLAAAVQGVNEICGTNVEVTDAINGVLSENIDNLRKSTQEWINNAKAQAAREELVELAKQQLKNEEALTEAKAQYNRMMQVEAAAREQNIPLTQTEIEMLAEAETALAKATETYDSNATAQERLTMKIAEATGALDAAKASITAFIESHDGWQQALETTGFTVEQLSSKLAQLGFTDSDFANLGEQGAEAMRMLAQGIATNADLGPSEARIVLDAIVLELNNGDVKAASEQLGHDIDAGLKAGIEGSADMPSAAAGIMSQQTIDAAKEAFDSHSPSRVMEQIGNDVDAGLKQGIDGNSSEPVNAMSNVGKQVADALAGVPGKARTYGSSSSQGFAGGVGSGSSSARASGTQVASSARDGMKSQDGNARTWGSHLGQLFSSGISAAGSFVRSAASGLAGIVKGILGHTVAKEGPLHEGGEGEKRWGRHLVQNIAEGMLDSKDEIRDAAEEIAETVEESLSADNLLSDWDNLIETGEGIARGIMVGYDRVDPMRYMAASMGTMMTSNVTNNNVNKTFNINQQVATPDEIFRAARKEEMYGLAGGYV